MASIIHCHFLKEDKNNKIYVLHTYTHIYPGTYSYIYVLIYVQRSLERDTRNWKY